MTVTVFCDGRGWVFEIVTKVKVARLSIFRERPILTHHYRSSEDSGPMQQGKARGKNTNQQCNHTNSKIHNFQYFHFLPPVKIGLSLI
jgi:hypothetical protein